MKLLRIWFLALFFILLLVNMTSAEESNKKIINATKIDTNEAPVIDGKLNDECWKKAGVASDFIQQEPILGGQPKEATKVYVLFDKEKLYVGFECYKEKLDKVLGSQMKRDGPFYQDDYVEVFLDTFHDRRNCYGFAVNCLGTQSDRQIANEGSTEERGPFGDRSKAWDCEWIAKSSKGYPGWTAEMAIPFSELRFNKKGDCIWGINFIRGNEEFDSEDTWADVGERKMSVSRFGCLTGLTPEDLVVSRPMEFKPYATVRPQITSEESDLSPMERFEPDMGIDIRYPSSILTADFTINPDFAQVEADPNQVNLNDVERRLAEKRSFFQEGMELFQMPMELFYTRRVGLKELDFGAKVAGKIGNYNIAFLDCQSDDTLPVVDDPVIMEDRENETKNNYFVFRTQRDIGANSSIGFIGINKQKAKSYNRIGGADLNMALPYNLRFMGQYARAIDADDGSDNAYVMTFRGDRNPMGFELNYSDIGANFVAEPGFIPRVDRRGFRGGVGGEYKRDAKIFRETRGHVFFEKLQNHDGLRTNDRYGLEIMSRISDFFISVEPQWYYHVNEDDLSIDYTDKTISFFTGWFPPKWASVRSRAAFGYQENKDIFFIGPSISLTPTEKLRFEFDFEKVNREDKKFKTN
ncbi:carbohydrate binding family 9 domain-containing protein, partial [Candidatus Poribacteria bacterium]|nr:carbohydrate binding family 9 domain-containing protein [Candidatus Poribacteria bacterium]